MKKYTLLVLFIGILALAGYSMLIKDNNQVNTIAVKEESSQDFKFNLDVNSLSYQLPVYTKICTPESRYNCSTEGCEKSKPVVFVLYDENTSKVYRCDNNPCDEYSVKEDISGLYKNLTPIIPNGSLVKLSSDNEYVETVSLGLDFIIYRGHCTDKK